MVDFFLLSTYHPNGFQRCGESSFFSQYVTQCVYKWHSNVFLISLDHVCALLGITSEINPDRERNQSRIWACWVFLNGGIESFVNLYGRLVGRFRCHSPMTKCQRAQGAVRVSPVNEIHPLGRRNLRAKCQSISVWTNPGPKFMQPFLCVWDIKTMIYCRETKASVWLENLHH